MAASWKRPRHRLAARLGALVLLAGCAPPQPPDVLLLVVGTLRADRLGSYGSHPPGFGVVALAKDGIVFENAVSASPQTAPALASLFTSQRPSRHGLLRAGDALPADVPTLAESFREAGYRTVAVSASTAFADPERGLARGFDEVPSFPRARRTEERLRGRAAARVRDRAITKRAIEVLEEDRTDPLFLLVHWMAPHADYAARGRFKRMGERNFSGPVDGTEAQLMQLARGEMTLDGLDRVHLASLYEAEVWSSDSQVKALVEYLDRLDALDPKLVAFTSDHGESLGEEGRFGHDTTLNREVLHVPLVLRLPGGRRGGTRVAPVVGLVDVGPTLLALAGVAPLSGAEGRPLVALLEDGVDPAPRPVVSELHPDEAVAAAWGPQRHTTAVTGERFSLLVAADGGVTLHDASDRAQTRDLAETLPAEVERLRSALAP